MSSPTARRFNKVAADIPEDQLLTSFSILFARKKGDLDRYVDGLKALESMRPGAKVLVLESCSHHRQAGRYWYGKNPPALPADGAQGWRVYFCA